MTKNEKFIYAAGLFDGEGCVKPYSAQAKSRKVRNFVYELALANNDHRVCEFMKSLFGGTISYYPTSSGKVQARWRITGEASSAAAAAMIPYSISKKSQLRLFLKLRGMIQANRHGPGQRLSNRERQQRQTIIDEIKQAKREVDVYVG
jgi:hypothetical protein